MDRQLVFPQPDGRSIACRVVGDGPPLVLINGYSGAAADWDPTFLHALAEARTVYCIDNAGVGASSPIVPDALSIDAMASDVVALVHAASLDSIDLVGWSMGGYIAQRVAARADVAINRLALIATDPGARQAVIAPSATWSRLTDVSGTPHEQAVRLLALLFPPAIAATLPPEVADLVAAARAKLDPNVLAAQARAIHNWQNRVAEAITNPPVTQIFHGALDEVIPVTNATLLAHRWRTQQRRVFDDAGHAVMAQYPLDIAHAIVSGEVHAWT